MRNLFSFVLVACGPIAPGGIVLKTNFSQLNAVQAQAILETVQAINTQLECQAVTVVDGNCGSNDECLSFVSQDLLMSQYPDGLGIVGLDQTNTLTDASRVEVFSDMDEDYTRDVLIHEIGHAFGLVHTPEGIMKADLNTAWVLGDMLGSLPAFTDAIQNAGFDCSNVPENLPSVSVEYAKLSGRMKI